jgi:methyl-accepting chemotaxis protein
MGNRVNELTESLLLGVGAFRFEAHARAESFVQEIVSALVRSMHSREELESVLEGWLQDNPCFELAYITNASGRQIVSNIGREGHAIVREQSGFGRDWSERSWFREGTTSRGAISTDIYRSAASGDFCFTVSAGLRDRSGGLLGVLGADVSFRRIISQPERVG